MLKKSLIATAAISATLFAAATILPALARSSSAAPANATSASTAPTNAQAPVDAGLRDKRSAADDSGTRASTSQSMRGQERHKTKWSERDERYGEEGGGGSSGKDKQKEQHKSRD